MTANGPTLTASGGKGRTQGPSGQPGLAPGQAQGSVQAGAAPGQVAGAASGQSLNEILASTLGLDATAFTNMVNGNHLRKQLRPYFLRFNSNFRKKKKKMLFFLFASSLLFSPTQLISFFFFAYGRLQLKQFQSRAICLINRCNLKIIKRLTVSKLSVTEILNNKLSFRLLSIRSN